MPSPMPERTTPAARRKRSRVSHAQAASGVPRRLAKPATEAILQWQFAPLAQARTADVEISFRRD